MTEVGPVGPLFLSDLHALDKMLVTATVVLEAEGEPFEGQVAVARVIRNRMERWHQTVSQVVLYVRQFSAWNHDGPRREKLSTLFTSPAWATAERAVAAAFSVSPDPSGGATHYLDAAETWRERVDGSLPSWFSADRVTARIGRHTFLVAA